MKFAKELERDLVPEWHLKYLDYKLGKKRLQAIKRALRTVNQTPRLHRWGNSASTPAPFEAAPQYSFINRDKPAGHDETARDDTVRNRSGDLRALAISNSHASLRLKQQDSRSSHARATGRSSEEQPLDVRGDTNFPGMTRYGSIIGSPPKDGGGRNNPLSRAPPSLRLPGAALDPEDASLAGAPGASPFNVPPAQSLPPPASSENAFEIGKTKSPHNKSYGTLPPRYKSVFSPKRINSTPGPQTQTAQSRPFVKRLISMGQPKAPSTPGDVPLEAYRDLDIRQADFFSFLDMELEKVETFYKQKEGEATERLNVLREQLHIMRDLRLEDLVHHEAYKSKAKDSRKGTVAEPLMNGQQSSSDDERPTSKGKSNLLNPLDSALRAIHSGHYGKTTKAMADLATPSVLFPKIHPDDLRDYVRRPNVPDVPYQTAKKKLKIALQEYYRGLELLKSYALLNRTAFRKINKKYDKTVNARPSMRYMTEKVNKAWFVESDIIEGHIRTVEDIYARYFERGNHKVAVGKLRIKTARAGDYTENSFRNGLTLAAGLVFGIQGLVYGCELLSSSNAKLATDTSYLLQIYAGYFLINVLFLLFCLACRVWHASKINYVFVFEYDTRHHLDWRQLSELPCFFIFLLGLFMWLNFSQTGSMRMYYYFPVILIGLTALLIVMPIPILFHRSRQWLLYSVWRLFLAGLYPVEFRDFYLGDMFCSLTYCMGNIELFFCLYANAWGNPPMCNSSHSRLLGFFASLPGIWRALQCIRRYYDTRNVFPHLVNCGKYAATILFYVTLSIYRINKNEQNRALFITFATINAVYTSIWDVFMDWSLGDPHAKHRFLRQTLGYKKVWMYYVAMVIDPILRFNWIPYAVVPLQLQHSAVTSFVVALSEVCRRAMWTLFRVENEHCTNVGRFRASRDVPLPYEVPSPEIKARENEERERSQPRQVADHEPQGQDHSQAQTSGSGSPRARRTSTAPSSGHLTSYAATIAPTADVENQLRRWPSPLHRAATGGGIPEEPSPFVRGLSRVGSIMRDAHAQDFERKKRPELGRSSSGQFQVDGHDDSSDDDDDDEGEDEEEEGEEGEINGHSTGSDGDEEDIQRVRREVEIGRSETGGD